MTKWGRKKTPSSSISNHVFLKNKQGDARPDEDQLHSTDVGRNTANKISEDDDVDWKVSLEKGRDEEDVKKPWMKMKKDRRVVEDAFSTDFDSFAIVKTSYNPQKDFRESMTEMIMEKQLKKREELEELLACYLTLNCDGFHDLIVNVFRQVWFELNQLHFDQHMEF
ncbi:Ovate protein family, C-terminal [Cynara cardunculus var. scolymus]|uniref:Transcription repressor n=1 Tax=Cynara cardunculus var. scolymus TaxID=59895 RepID=A0A103Y1S5_CYNCS|nr:Ovate protein family, C-terminal [Cynara cardunculus var. scolymus]